MIFDKKKPAPEGASWCLRDSSDLRTRVVILLCQKLYEAVCESSYIIIHRLVAV